MRPSIRGYTWIIESLPVDPFDLPLFEGAFIQATRSFFGHCEFRRVYSLRSSGLSFVFHVRVRFCAGGVPPSFHPTYPIPNRTTRHPSRPNTRIHGQRVFDRFTGANGKAQVIERIEVIGEDTTIAPVRRPAHPSGRSRL